MLKIPDEVDAVLQRLSLLATLRFKHILQVALKFTAPLLLKAHTHTNTLALFFPF